MSEGIPTYAAPDGAARRLTSASATRVSASRALRALVARTRPSSSRLASGAKSAA